MKIAWFTPFTKASAIGRFSRLITGELAKSHDVDVWHPQADEIHATKLRTVSFSASVQFSPGMLSPYDIVVYNIGDHLPYHRDIWLASQEVPGITVLHDFVMHHFFAGYYLMERKSRNDYLEAMVRLYGAEGRAVTERAFADIPPWVWETDRVIEFPFFEEAMRRAHAVVVHSSFFREKVEARFAGPVRKLSLPYDCPAAGRSILRRELGIPDDHVLIITVGQVNPNKRIASTIQALARNRDTCARVVYAILGSCEGPYRDELVKLIREHRLEKTVRILGYTPDDRLHAYLTHADVCINLRYPAMEGGSASIIEEMLYGKPVVVSNNGVYSELPDDCVWKVSPEQEIEDLSAALRALVADKAMRKAMGTRARCFAEEEFSAEKYARGFLDLCDELLDAKPLLHVTDRMAARLAQMGVQPGMSIVENLSREIHNLFVNGGRNAAEAVHSLPAIGASATI